MLHGRRSLSVAKLQSWWLVAHGTSVRQVAGWAVWRDGDGAIASVVARASVDVGRGGDCRDGWNSRGDGGPTVHV